MSREDMNWKIKGKWEEDRRCVQSRVIGGGDAKYRQQLESYLNSGWIRPKRDRVSL